jgi:hypothetical protein
LDEIYSDHKEALAAAGMTAEQHVRMTHAVARALEQAPEAYLAALKDFREGRSAVHPAHWLYQQAEQQRYAGEYERFTEKRNISPALKHKMGEHLLEHPPVPGESVQAALMRAYKAVKPTKEPKPGEAWSAAAAEAWDEVGAGSHMRRP